MSVMNGPSSDWEQSTGSGQSEAQEFGCIVCATQGVLDNPKTVYMYNARTLCGEHLMLTMELEDE